MTFPDPQPSPHPALAGREEEMGALADALRRLVELTVTCDAPPGTAKAIADELGTLADRLAVHVPDPPLARFVARSQDAGFDEATMHASMPYDVVIGRYNPLALPISIEARPPKVHGRGRFTKAYEGAPGWVHGAVIAGAFDIVLTAANRLTGAAGPTRRLSLRYLRPTLLEEEAVLEAWVEDRTPTRVTSKGRLVQRGAVTVEAVGEFAVMDPARMGR